MIKRFNDNDIDEIVKILKNDGVISVPTDTVFGICSRINSIDSYNNLLKVKNRSLAKPFPVMCCDKEQIKMIAIVGEREEKIIDTFMPGPITLVLKKREYLDDYITNGKDSIAVRMATSDVLKKIINKLGSPIFMTSANQTDQKVCTSLDEIEMCCPLLDGMLDGEVYFSKGSTIIDCCSELRVLREGPISLEDINNIL